MPSLPNTLRRCHSTVRELMNSCAPISGLVSPQAASRAICASCAVRSRGSRRPVAHGLAGGQQLATGPLGERFHADPGSISWAVRSCSRASTGGSRGAAIRRTGGGRGRDGRGCGCGRAARSPRGRGPRRSRLAQQRPRRASMPSAQSVPAGRVRSASRPSASTALGLPPSGGRLDQLDQRPRGEPHSSVSSLPPAAASASS